MLRLDVDRRNCDNVKMVCFVRLLLIFAILACPFNCMGALSEGNAQTAISPGCSCCSHGSSGERSAPDRLPNSPDDDCQCPTCFCNGPVLPSDGVARDLGDDGPHSSHAVLVENLQGESPLTSAALADGCSGPPTSLPSGRYVRILHESFLL